MGKRKLFVEGSCRPPKNQANGMQCFLEIQFSDNSIRETPFISSRFIAQDYFRAFQHSKLYVFVHTGGKFLKLVHSLHP
jgi:hypothetical protein